MKATSILITLVSSVFFFFSETERSNPPPPCPWGNKTFHNQTDIDDFVNTYGDCNLVQGDLIIGDSNSSDDIEITNLSGLMGLEVVTGKLIVGNTNRLKNLEGLNNLTSIGDGIELEFNDSLSNISALANVQSFEGEIDCNTNKALLNFDGLQGATSIKYLRLYDNHSLINFQGLENLVDIEEKFYLYGSDSLTSLDGLGSLQSIGEYFVILDCPLLTNVTALSNLSSIGGGMTIFDCHALNSLSGFESLTSVGGWIHLRNSSNLTSLEGLNNLTSVGSYFVIDACPSLINLQGLNSLSTIGLYFYIEENHELISLEGLDNLTSIGTNLRITGNDSLQNLIGLEGIQQLSGYLRISGSEPLSNFNPLNNLTTVGGDLYITGIGSITHMEGFENLESVGEDLSIIGNPNLSNIEGFQQLNYVGSTLKISSNPNLSECAVKFVCQHLASSSNFTLLNNGAGCNDENQVYEDCDIGTFVGKVSFDENDNCLPDNNEANLSGWKVAAVSNDFTNITFTDNLGNYELGALAGTYAVQIIPPASFWSPCSNTTFEIQGAYDTVQVDLMTQSTIDCPLLEVDLLSTRLRTCRESRYTAEWCNRGSATADNAYIDIYLLQHLTILSASIPYTVNSDNVATFQIGDVAPGACGKLTFDAFVSCDVITGQTVCATARIYPDTLCTPPPSNWSGAELFVRGICEPSGVKFFVVNDGLENMTVPSDYLVLKNGLPFNSGQVQLDAGEEQEFIYPLDNSTYRFEVDQVLDHPQNTIPAATVESWCETNSNNFALGHVLEFPLEDYAESFDRYCLEITGSFDPNDKQGFPKGYGSDQIIEVNTSIEYLIRFQNTGNDTAFNVVILDTLSEYLDLNSIDLGVSSHSMKMEVLPDNVLEFSFENIMLPDSNINQLGSNGFLTYRIKQLPDLPLGTEIKNSAAIYFDFNEPIITNETNHLIGRITTSYLEQLEICEGESYNGVTYYETTYLTDTVSTGIFDNVYGLEILVHPSYEIEIDTVLVLGELYQGILYEQDTTIQNILESQFGCDSIVTVNIMINVVGVTNLKNINAQVSFQPNPFHNNTIIKIENAEFQIGKLEIYNLMGKKVHVENFNETLFTLERNKMNSGIYFYQIILDQQPVKNGKLIIH